MKYLGILLLSFSLIQCKQNVLHQGNGTTIKIVLDTEEPLQESETIYITGNQSVLGAWNPSALSMTRRSETRWEKTFTVDSPHVEFKFTLGSYEREAISNRGVVPANSIIEAVRDTEVYFVIEDWKNPDGPMQTSYGTLESFLIQPTNGIKWRKVHVLLPEGYDPKASIRYPVIYLHDGQNQFDSSKSFIHQEWQIDETVANLIRSNKIVAPICVAINNTDDRSMEYGDVSENNKYIDFIIHQLKPKIDSTYLTLPDRKNTSTMGSSLGGLIAFSLAWYHPEIFSEAACLSPAFKLRSIDMVTKVKSYEGNKKDILLYFDNGTVGLEAELQPGIDEMKKSLESKGYRIEYTIAQGAEHNESAWAKRIEKPLTMFFGK